MLSIEDAIRIGVEKNYNVLVSKNLNLISREQNNFGNAGMSPTVSLSGNYNYSSLNSHQEFNTGVTQDRAGANSTNYGASANVSWLIFDGMRMFAVKKRLGMNEQLTALQLQKQIEITVHDIILAYYDIIRIKELIKAQNQNLQVYSERKNIAQVRMDVGSASNVDLLLTKSDENRAKSDLLQLELQLLSAKATLNNMLIRAVDIDFNTSDSIVTSYNPTLDELKKSVQEKNSDILISRQNELIIGQTIREAQALNLPFIQLNGAYNLNGLKSQAGLVALSRQIGPTAGITANWTIFNGNRINKLVKERQINLLNQRYVTDQTKMSVDAVVYINYQVYLTNKKVLDLEAKNLADSREVLNVSLERYRVGKANLLETIETQKNLEDAQVRYFNALYNVKKAETELLRSNGALVK
jgi:outer membrane protein TolC